MQAGGDLYFAGSKGERPWRAGIRDPRGPRGSLFATLTIRDATLSTSGDYERFYRYAGKRYHHIIDPRSGRPARRCRSVTVVTPDATTADWLSTSVFILGPERGLRLVERLPRTGAVIVAADNRVLISSRLRGRVRILRPPSR